MYRADVAFLGVFLLVGGAILWLTPGFPETGELAGPAFFPRGLAVLLLGLTGGLAVRWVAAYRRGHLVKVDLPPNFGTKAALFGLMLVAYSALLGRGTSLGFPGLTFLFLVGTASLFGGRSPLKVFLLSGGVALGVYLFFRVWLNIPLPRSAWF